MEKGATETLVATYSPTDTTEDTTITWSSSNEKVATVNSTGTVTATGAGETTITAKVGEKTATCSIKVYVPLKGISMTRDSITLPEKQISTRKVVYNPEDTTDDKTVTWTSNDENIATVDSNGKVTAVSAGETTITAQVGSFTTSYTIKVEGIIGDMDGDNKITAFDSYKALYESCKTEQSEDSIFKLDVDGNEELTSFDAYKILERSAGIVDAKYWK